MKFNKTVFATGLATLLLILFGNASVFAGYQGGVNVYAYAESRPTVETDPYGLDSYFAIYYAKDDNKSFERSADTWIRELKKSSDYNPKCDEVFKVGVTTRKDFISAWDGIDQKVKARKGTVPGDEWKVRTGKIFSHGGCVKLYFTPDDPNDQGSGSLGVLQTQKLKTLDWHDDGQLSIHACNSGNKPPDGSSCVAEQFCFGQGVAVLGLPGDGMFSSVPPPNDFEPIERLGGVLGRSKDVYLNSYYRTTNVPGGGNGDGQYMPPCPYNPPSNDPDPNGAQ